jgi:hypothetical protein
MVSSELIETYQEISREHTKGRHGIYALYLGDSLQYVGLATDLRMRLEGHLKDRHAGKWDKFSIYLTKSESHLKELETLVIRIAKPPENRQRGNFIDCENLRPILIDEYNRLKAIEIDKLFGDNKPTGPVAKAPTPKLAPAKPARREKGGRQEGSAAALFTKIFSANNKERLTDPEIQAKVVKAFPKDKCWRWLSYMNYMRWAYNSGKLTPGKPKEPAKRWIKVNGKRVAATGPVRGEQPIAAGCKAGFLRSTTR